MLHYVVRGFAFSCVSLWVLFGVGCGDPVEPAVDGGIVMRDANIPDGPTATILRIPETDQRTLPTLQHEVNVVYTEAHVPHIYAQSERDMYVAQGFIVARDRYFTFEIARRLALGRVAELLGDIGLATDLDSRSRGMAVIAERLYSSLTPDQLDMFAAYAEGINAYIDAVKMNRAVASSELSFAAPILGARNAGELMENVTARDVVSFAAVVVFQLGFESLDVERGRVATFLQTAFEGDAHQALRRNGAIEDILNHVTPIHDVVEAPNGFGLEDGTTPARAHVRRRERTPRNAR